MASVYDDVYDDDDDYQYDKIEDVCIATDTRTA